MLKLSRRLLLAAGLLGAGAGGAAWLGGRAPPPPSPTGHGDPPRIYPPEGGRVVLDPARFPTTYRQAPQLAGLKLPPVAERIGLDPLVIEPLHEPGRYGGTMRRAFTGPGDFQTATRFLAGPDGLLYWDADWRTVVPNIARGFEMSSDGRVLTVFLRRGMRWSDGAPFTADDVMFWYEDMHNDRRVVARPSTALLIEGDPVRIERVDTAAIQFVSPRPYHMLPEVLASWSDLSGPSIMGRVGLGGFAPKHYLSRFHPKYADEAAITRAAREAGFANWAIRLKSANDWTLNPELPVVGPWRVVEAINTESFTLERNPYSIWVDTEGAQLPYIDRVRHVFCSNPEAVNFKAGVGGVDEQDRHLSLGKLPFLLANRNRSGYDVHLDPFEGCDLGIRINLDYREDREIGDLLKTADFRRALSLATDRVAINETLMLGVGRPSSSVPARNNKYYPGDEWADRWARHDVKQANRMLDDLGLGSRDARGLRLRRDGKGPLRIVFHTFISHFDYPAVAEMIREQWRDVGVDLDIQTIESNLFSQKCAAGEIQISAQFSGSEEPFLFPDYLFPSSSAGSSPLSGPEYVRWFQTYGRDGARPPPEVQALMDMWRRGREVTAEERIPIGQEMIRRHIEEVMTIGLVSGSPSFYGVRVTSRALGNVPRRVRNSQAVRSPANSLPMTYYFRDQEAT